MMTRGRTTDRPELDTRRSASPPATLQEQHPPTAGNPADAGTTVPTADHLSSVRSQLTEDLNARFNALEERIISMLERFTVSTPAGPPDVTSTPPTHNTLGPEPRFSAPPPSGLHPSMRGSEAPSSDSHHPRLKASDLPTFHGNNSDAVDDWVDQVDAIWAFAQVTEANLLAVIPLVLKDHALKWFVGLGAQRFEMNTWALWKHALRNAFRPPNYEEYIHHQMTRRHLKPDESFGDYFQEKVQLLNKAYGTSVSYKVKLHELMAGIPSWMHPTIKSNSRDVTSLEGFRRTLMDLEEGLRAQWSLFDLGLESEDEQPTSTTSMPPATQQQRHLQPLPPQQAVYRQQPRYNTADSPERNSASVLDYTFRPQQDKSYITCFKCRQKGHYANECSNAPAGENTQASS